MSDTLYAVLSAVLTWAVASMGVILVPRREGKITLEGYAFVILASLSSVLAIFFSLSDYRQRHAAEEGYLKQIRQRLALLRLSSNVDQSAYFLGELEHPPANTPLSILDDRVQRVVKEAKAMLLSQRLRDLLDQKSTLNLLQHQIDGFMNENEETIAQAPVDLRRDILKAFVLLYTSVGATERSDSVRTLALRELRGSEALGSLSSYYLSEASLLIDQAENQLYRGKPIEAMRSCSTAAKLCNNVLTSADSLGTASHSLPQMRVVFLKAKRYLINSARSAFGDSATIATFKPYFDDALSENGVIGRWQDSRDPEVLGELLRTRAQLASLEESNGFHRRAGELYESILREYASRWTKKGLDEKFYYYTMALSARVRCMFGDFALADARLSLAQEAFLSHRESWFRLTVDRIRGQYFVEKYKVGKLNMEEEREGWRFLLRNKEELERWGDVREIGKAYLNLANWFELHHDRIEARHYREKAAALGIHLGPGLS